MMLLEKIMRSGYTMTIIQGVSDPICDVVDVEVVLENGDRYIPTLVTLEWIRQFWQRQDPNSLQSKWYWEVDFVVVKQLTREIIIGVIDEMVQKDHISSISKRYLRDDD